MNTFEERLNQANEDKQKITDICFSVGLMIHNHGSFRQRTMSNEDLAQWIASQLAACGFPTRPVGSSWGVLLGNCPSCGFPIKENEKYFQAERGIFCESCSKR